MILFDGVCDLCNTGARWIRGRDRAGRFELLPYQSDEARHRYPDLDPAELARVMHVIAPGGEVRTGVDAAPWIFGGLPGWSVLARLLALPLVRKGARPVYAWLAARRRILNAPGTGPPACDLPRPADPTSS